PGRDRHIENRVRAEVLRERARIRLPRDARFVEPFASEHLHRRLERNDIVAARDERSGDRREEESRRFRIGAPASHRKDEDRLRLVLIVAREARVIGRGAGREDEEKSEAREKRPKHRSRGVVKRVLAHDADSSVAASPASLSAGGVDPPSPRCSASASGSARPPPSRSLLSDDTKTFDSG